MPVKDLMHDPSSRERYGAKHLWQLAHNKICGRLPVICGHNFAVFRSKETGAYYKGGKLQGNDTPIQYETGMDYEKIKDYSASGRLFLSQLPVRRDCIILTTIPTDRTHALYSPSIETGEAVAKELGVKFAAVPLDGLRTFDGLHLDQLSAERWSEAFFQVAGPMISACVRGSS